MRTVVLALVCIALGFGLSAWKIPTAVKAQTAATQTPDVANISTGRFQIAHIYYSAVRQGTVIIDSQTGRVFELATGKDKDGKDMAVFQQTAIRFCLDPSCNDYGGESQACQHRPSLCSRNRQPRPH
jgi:hypothetical protein